MINIILILIFAADNVFGELNSTQRDYVPELKLISVEYVDKSLIGPNPTFKFRKVNKTQFALNAEIELIKDLDASKMTSISEVYMLLNNHYKFTGIKQAVNVCESWERNDYSIRTLLQKYTNIDACNIVKKRYWIKDYTLDTSMYPKSLPLGTYKAIITVTYDGVTCLQLAFHLKLNYYANWQKQSSNRLKIKIF